MSLRLVGGGAIVFLALVTSAIPGQGAATNPPLSQPNMSSPRVEVPSGQNAIGNWRGVGSGRRVRIDLRRELTSLVVTMEHVSGSKH